MPKVKISEYSATANSNTDVASINIDEGCAPSGINNAIRAVMGHLKDFQQGTNGDPFNGPHNGTVGATTPSTGAFTSITASTTLGVTGVATFSAGTAALPAITTTGDTNTGIFFPAADTIAFSDGGVEAMRIDSSGNLGLGGTPSAWAAGQNAMQFKNGGLSLWAASGGQNGYIYSNAYYDGSNNRYINNGFANTYAINNASGIHAWFNAPSGTAGNVVSYTQAMTLDASGNLGVNNTSPTTLITSIGGAGGKGIVISGQVPVLYFEDTNGTDASIFVENGDIAFVNGTTEAARFSSGNLLVGTTSFVYTATGTQISDGQINIGSAGTGGSTLMNFGNGNGAVGSITVTGSATAYNTSSDYRLKNITGPLTGAKDFIMALKPKQGTWKVDGSAFVGFLAHEFQEVSPSSVSGEKDAVDVDGKPIMQAMQASSSEVMANLVAFIQEQQALITQLTARITALEGASA